jgi:esterase/lipase superfamily enzyme
VYTNDPSHYLSERADASWYRAMKRLEIIFAIGRADPHYQDNVHLSNVLWGRNLWHAFRTWDGWAHDWPYWQQMIRAYIGGAD